MNKKISDLSAVLVLIQESELMRLALLADQKNTTLAQLKDLADLKLPTKPTGQLSKTLQPWQLLGGDQKWQLWLNVRIAEKNSELAILSANFEEQKIKAQRAVGRHSAFKRIAAKQTKAL